MKILCLLLVSQSFMYLLLAFACRCMTQHMPLLMPFSTIISVPASTASPILLLYFGISRLNPQQTFFHYFSCNLHSLMIVPFLWLSHTQDQTSNLCICLCGVPQQENRELAMSLKLPINFIFFMLLSCSFHILFLISTLIRILSTSLCFFLDTQTVLGILLPIR